MKCVFSKKIVSFALAATALFAPLSSGLAASPARLDHNTPPAALLFTPFQSGALKDHAFTALRQDVATIELAPSVRGDLDALLQAGALAPRDVPIKDDRAEGEELGAILECGVAVKGGQLVERNALDRLTLIDEKGSTVYFNMDGRPMAYSEEGDFVTLSVGDIQKGMDEAALSASFVMEDSSALEEISEYGLGQPLPHGAGAKAGLSNRQVELGAYVAGKLCKAARSQLREEGGTPKLDSKIAKKHTAALRARDQTAVKAALGLQ